jgi:hypothetical protein
MPFDLAPRRRVSNLFGNGYSQPGSVALASAVTDQKMFIVHFLSTGGKPDKIRSFA